ncbi:YecA family protein [Clostridium sp. Marseille-Q7071]
MKDLSFKINENKYFYNNKYSGSPLIELPVFEKPFIEIENKFYCFDYYNLFDNIYRVLQKVIRKKDSSYSDMWGIRQMEATEKMVAELFKKILPDCIVYTSNYYPKSKSLKQCNENDVLVLYDDNLIIVEVKAGSYTYRAPILDIDSHVKSLQTLVEKADGQAERTLNYLKSNKTVKLYNKDKTEKCEITLGDFNDITLMCLTLDNFNEFSSKIEKLKFLNINKNSIALSIDDFRVYSDYFDSPLVFLHYLKQRKLATQNSALYLNDELDHLGMYIEHNMYSKIFERDDNGQIIAYGYREKLDEYFSSLINKGFELDKPKQKMPVQFKEIIDYLNRSNLNERVKLATFLLDFSSDERENIINNIKKAFNRQREINRMLILNLFEEKSMCIYCHQEGIENITDECAKEYTLATMLEAGESSRTELHLYYNDINKLKYIKFHFYTLSDIPKEREKEFVELGHKYFNTKLITYKQQNNIKKIGRNDLCPCGSGKKYKKCHGK